MISPLPHKFYEYSNSFLLTEAPHENENIYSRLGLKEDNWEMDHQNVERPTYHVYTARENMNNPLFEEHNTFESSQVDPNAGIHLQAEEAVTHPGTFQNSFGGQQQSLLGTFQGQTASQLGNLGASGQDPDGQAGIGLDGQAGVPSSHQPFPGVKLGPSEETIQKAKEERVKMVENNLKKFEEWQLALDTLSDEDSDEEQVCASGGEQVDTASVFGPGLEVDDSAVSQQNLPASMQELLEKLKNEPDSSIPPDIAEDFFKRLGLNFFQGKPWHDIGKCYMLFALIIYSYTVILILIC